MQKLDLTYQTLYSELSQRALDAAFSSDFSADGRFITMESRGRRYWYFDTAKEGGGKNRRYVGPVDDEAINRRVESLKDLKSDYRARRKIVSTLIREAYLPRPESFVGEIVQALANGGFFRLRGVLIGTVAFQAYSALLGVRLSNTAMQTGDADFAQFNSVSVEVDDGLPPILDLLRTVDETFREVPHPADSRHSTQFLTRSGFKVEFLTPNTGSTDHEGHPTSTPALGGASATPLRFLDYLIHDPVRAVLLHNAGIPVLVPAPERFAVHKLIVSSRRRTEGASADKGQKDLRQAQLLFQALNQVRRHTDLAIAYTEAWDRGPHWREALTHSLSKFEPEQRSLVDGLLTTGITELGDDPSDYGL